MPAKTLLTLRVNGETHEVAVPVHKTLLEVLREDLGLIGTKHGCELGECGTCTVLVDGQPVLSCLALPVELQGREILTVEGMAPPGQLHPLQQAFAELGAAQCGYCTPGILLTSMALLYLGILLYFKSIGGYKAVHLEGTHGAPAPPKA